METASYWSEANPTNFKQLGDKVIKRQNDTTPHNSGQVVKKFLREKVAIDDNLILDETCIQKLEIKPPKVRRQLKRVYPKVSGPVDVPSKKVKEDLMDNVSNEEVNLGVNIAPREYKRVIYDKKTSELITDTFTVYGRKHPMREIRERLFQKHRQYMRLNSDSYFDNLDDNELVRRLSAIRKVESHETLADMKAELKVSERSRNFVNWHDGSSISNHEHVLFCIHALFDRAVFYSSAEYKEITEGQEDVDIQSIVETPELYIISRCRSNDEQLSLVETRIECLMDLHIDLNLGEIDPEYSEIALNGTMRF